MYYNFNFFCLIDVIVCVIQCFFSHIPNEKIGCFKLLAIWHVDYIINFTFIIYCKKVGEVFHH